MKNEKILITGANSTVGGAFARSLIGDNEVWAAARYTNPATREALEKDGIKTVALDLGSGNFEGLPEDFTYLLHLAYFRGPKVSDIDEALRTNSEGTGFILHHCRNAKAALYMSSSVIYSPQEDPWYAFKEDDAIGGAQPTYSATSGISKIAGEAIARYCARQFDLPVTIARLNAPYGLGDRLLPNNHMAQVMADQTIITRGDPEPYTPIHLDDMCDQIAPLLDAASIPATVVNWAGDEDVTVQQWSEYAAEWGGKRATFRLEELPGTKRGNRADSTKRRSITGPCKVKFVDGLREVFDHQYGALATN